MRFIYIYRSPRPTVSDHRGCATRAGGATAQRPGQRPSSTSIGRRLPPGLPLSDTCSLESHRVTTHTGLRCTRCIRRSGAHGGRDLVIARRPSSTHAATRDHFRTVPQLFLRPGRRSTPSIRTSAPDVRRRIARQSPGASLNHPSAHNERRHHCSVRHGADRQVPHTTRSVCFRLLRLQLPGRCLRPRSGEEPYALREIRN
jgi:hypothetical protein